MAPWGRLEGLSDAHVLELRNRIAATCERIMAMPEDERRTITGKGGSAESAGFLSAVDVIMLDREVQRRGLEPAEAALGL